MTGPQVVIRCGSAYPDAVVERLATEVADCGLSARIEDFALPAEALADGDDDLDAGLIALEVPDDAFDTLLSPPMRTTVDVLVDAAQRRHRRQLAAGEVHDVAVILHLPGDVRVVVSSDASTHRTDLMLAAVVRRRVAGSLTAGAWWWNPTELRLDRPWREHPTDGS
jgi:hypothetical protein